MVDKIAKRLYEERVSFQSSHFSSFRGEGGHKRIGCQSCGQALTECLQDHWLFQDRFSKILKGNSAISVDVHFFRDHLYKVLKMYFG